MSELKPCPWCGSPARPIWINTFTSERMTGCSNVHCFLFTHGITVFEWQSRPIEDALQAKIDEQAKRIEKLEEMSKWIQVDMDVPDTGDCIEFIDSNEVIRKGYYNRGFMDADHGNMQISDVIGWRLRGAR